MADDLTCLLGRIRACTLCAESLPLGPRPVLREAPGARIMLIGQAPGTAVHRSGIPWDNPSGRRLRQWLDVDDDTFDDPERFAIVPMGFCYPGKGRSGDLPPRPECAPAGHPGLGARPAYFRHPAAKRTSAVISSPPTRRASSAYVASYALSPDCLLSSASAAADGGV
jgi:hypothetical protein